MPLVDPVTMAGIATPSQPPATKSTQPVSILPAEIARIATHVHPVLLLSTYYLRFSSLVANPISTLATGLIPLAILQTLYCILCLPVAPSSEGSGKRIPKKTKLGARGKRSVESTVTFSTLSHSFLSLLLATVLAGPLLILQILLGAPLTTQLVETALSSLHLSLLCLYPLVYVRGLDSIAWFEIASAQAPFDEVFGAAVGACVGAWLGAVPIPLDWDRDWQTWPITVVTGMYIGWVVGKDVGGYLIKGKRIEFS